jgi:hypothetical protein
MRSVSGESPSHSMSPRAVMWLCVCCPGSKRLGLRPHNTCSEACRQVCQSCRTLSSASSGAWSVCNVGQSQALPAAVGPCTAGERQQRWIPPRMVAAHRPGHLPADWRRPFSAKAAGTSSAACRCCRAGRAPACAPQRGNEWLARHAQCCRFRVHNTLCPQMLLRGTCARYRHVLCACHGAMRRSLHVRLCGERRHSACADLDDKGAQQRHIAPAEAGGCVRAPGVDERHGFHVAPVVRPARAPCKDMYRS